MLWLLPQWGLLDKPDFARHIHTHAVPRGGGLGMQLAFVAVVIVGFGLLHGSGKADSTDMLKLLAPLGILLPLGLLDDRFCLKARTKFLFQILAAVMAWRLGFRMNGCFGVSFPPWLGCFLTIFWIVAFINAFNMIDGVDGLAAGIGFISSTCMVVIAMVNRQYPLAVLLIVFAFALLGFLYYNWHPARLFMGDTGSMFIGYVLAVSGLCLNAHTLSVASIGIPLLACGIPMMDICLAVWRRVMGVSTNRPASLDAPMNDGAAAPESFPRRLAHLAERLGTADQSHIHHRLLRHFQNNQRKTILNIYAMALCLGVVGIACCFLPNNNLLLAMTIILGTFSFILNRLAFIELWNSTERLYHNFQSAHAGIIISYAINPLWDLGCIVAAYVIAARSIPISASCLLRYTAILMGVLCCSRSYRVFWNFAVSDDYFRLIRTLLYGFIIARGSDVFMRSHHVTRLHSYAACVAIALIMLERLGIHYLRNWQVRKFGASNLNCAPKIRTLLVGVTPLTRFYRNYLLSDIEHAGSEHLVGIVTGAHGFQHSYCFGLKVLGRLDDLESIIQEMSIGRVVLTEELPPAALDSIRQTCLAHNIPLARFQCKESAVSG